MINLITKCNGTVNMYWPLLPHVPVIPISSAVLAFSKSVFGGICTWGPWVPNLALVCNTRVSTWVPYLPNYTCSGMFGVRVYWHLSVWVFNVTSSYLDVIFLVFFFFFFYPPADGEK